MNSISAKEFLITTVLVSAFVGLSYELDCFYCEPDDKGCDNPVGAGRANEDCRSLSGNGNPMTRVLDQERNRVQDTGSVTYLCAALNVVNEQDKNASGIFRTCVVNTTTSDQCNVLKNEFADELIGNIVSCKTCNTSLCNSWTIDGFKNSSPESFTSVLLYTFLSCFFVVYVI